MTYYIKTYGCQANIADSNTMEGILEALDFEPLNVPAFNTEKETMLYVFSNADLVVVNTCSVRQKSEDKTYGMGKIAKMALEKYGKKPFTVMAGCMVGSVTGDRQRYSFEELKKKTPWVDMYMNPHEIKQLPELLAEKGMLSEWAMKKLGNTDFMPKSDAQDHAFINISQGCDNFCTFCVVPYSRGREASRTEEEILKEIRHFAMRGVKKVTLCAQNVNSWGMDMKEKFEVRTGSDQKLPFAALLRKIHEIPEIEKISFLSSNPFDFTQDLIETLALPKVENYLHIAVQSGNNDVLKRMNRRHSIEDFLTLINKIKKVRPDIEIGTDLIVGFPGETREQFMDTVDLVKKVNFSVAFIAMYSPRKGTPSEKFFKDDVSAEEKKYRHSLLTKVWRATKV